MNVDDIHPGVRVQTHDLDRPAGLLAPIKFLGCRREGKIGTVQIPMGEHEHAWWVKHDDGTIAPYWFNELDPGPPAPEKPDPFKGRPF